MIWFSFQIDNFQFINPSEAQFPGLQKIYDELCDWEWIYGRTPNFSLTRHFANNLEYYIEHQITVNVSIEKGRISKIDIETNFNETYLKMRPLIQEHLIGTRFWLNDLQMSLNMINQESRHFGEVELHSWVVNCLSKVLCVWYNRSNHQC